MVAPVERFDPDRLCRRPAGRGRPDSGMDTHRPSDNAVSALAVRAVGRLTAETIAVFGDRLKAAQGLE